MDIFWILDPDPDPHNNRCGSATLLVSTFFPQNFEKLNIMKSFFLDPDPDLYGGFPDPGSRSV